MDSVLSSVRIGGSVALAILGNLILIPVALFYFLMRSEEHTSELQSH